MYNLPSIISMPLAIISFTPSSNLEVLAANPAVIVVTMFFPASLNLVSWSVAAIASTTGFTTVSLTSLFMVAFLSTKAAINVSTIVSPALVTFSRLSSFTRVFAITLTNLFDCNINLGIMSSIPCMVTSRLSALSCISFTSCSYRGGISAAFSNVSVRPDMSTADASLASLIILYAETMSIIAPSRCPTVPQPRLSLYTPLS